MTSQLHFYERIDPLDVACLFLHHKDIKKTPNWAVNSKHTVYSRKGLCVVSKYPFLWQLRQFLR